MTRLSNCVAAWAIVADLPPRARYDSQPLNHRKKDSRLASPRPIMNVVTDMIAYPWVGFLAAFCLVLRYSPRSAAAALNLPTVKLCSDLCSIRLLRRQKFLAYL